MKFSIFSIIAVTASIVSTVSAQELPTCAKNCVSETISQKLLTCTSPNAACVCSGTEPAVRNVAACVQGTCNQLEIQEFVKQVLDLCGDEPTTTTTGATATGTATTRVTAPTGGNNTTRRTTTTSATTTATTTTVSGNFTLTTTRTTTATGTTTGANNGTSTTTSATTTTSSQGAAVKIMGGSGAAGMGSVAIALVVAAFLG